jgi:chorismate mutase
MLEILGGIFSAATGGGALGLVGGLLRQGLDYFNKRAEIAREVEVLKENHAHDLAMRDKDRELMLAESTAQLRVVMEQGESLAEVTQINAIAASFAADKASYATGEAASNSPWFVAVDVVRGLIRPTITILFDLAMLAIWGLLMWLLWGQLGKLFAIADPSVVKPMMDLLLEITRAIIFLATTATGYWFVARASGGRT